MKTHNVLSSNLDAVQWEKAPGPIRCLGPELACTLEGLQAVSRILRVNAVEVDVLRDSGGEDGSPLDGNLTAGLHAAAEALSWNAHLILSKIRDGFSKENESGVGK